MLQKLLFFTLTLSFFSLSNFGQESLQENSSKCDSSFVEQLVRQQASVSKNIKDSENRINALILVADFLWDYDEEYGRLYFKDALEIAIATHNENKKEDKLIKSADFIPPRKDYRFVVIREIAKRDPRWAGKLAAKKLKDKKKDREQKKKYDRELVKDLRIAIDTAKSNPKKAMVLFRQAISNYPLQMDWYFELRQISRINPDLANQVFRELVIKNQNNYVSRLLFLSAYPFGTSKTFGHQTVFNAKPPPNFKPDRNLQILYLQTLLKRINNLKVTDANKTSDTAFGSVLTEAAQAYLALIDIAPLIETQFPELKQLFTQARMSANSRMNGKSFDSIRKTRRNKEERRKSIADILKELEDADAEGRLNDSLIVRVLWKVAITRSEENFKEFEKWLDRIKDDVVKEQAKDAFYFVRSQIALRKNRFIDARKYAQKVSMLNFRSVLYFFIADKKIKDHPSSNAEAMEVLYEAYKIANKAPDSVQKAQVFLGLAYIYAKFDYFNSMDSLGKAVETTNKLENPKIFSNQMQQIIKNSDGYVSAMGISVPGFDISQTFQRLGKNDFQGVLSQAQGFNDKYLQTLAILALVKTCKDKASNTSN